MHQCYNLSLFFSIEQTSIIQIRPVVFELPTLLKKKETGCPNQSLAIA